jgi:hypothetical protein
MMSAHIDLEALARAKRLDLGFLRNLGVDDSPDRGGVLIRYFAEDGREHSRTRLRTALRARDGSRWLGPTNIGPIPYGLWELPEARKRGFLILVEGETDAWALWNAGFPALGIPGATLAKVLRAEHLAGIPKIYVNHEPDQGGDAFIKGIAQRLREINFSGEALELATAPYKDPADAHCDNPGDFPRFIEGAMQAAQPLDFRAAAASDIKETRTGEYVEARGELFRAKTLPRGEEILIPLTNFTARIIADIERDDGAEITRHFEVEVKRGARTATTVVPAAQFAAMRWPVEALGCDAVVHAGAGAADHARCAILLLSHNVKRRTVYAHTGWRKINGAWAFLHGGGAIGADGPIDGVEVELPPEIAPLKLELPNDPPAALRASLRLLDLAPDRISVPLLGAVIRAVLGGADFTVFLYGRTGVFKTELAALAQAHFGAGFYARHLPANFTSTANSNEGLAFLAKDAILAVDEFAPPASGSERDIMHRDAARLLRSQGNAAGRARMRSDGSLRPAKPSRALLLATGEDLPRGQSARARMFVVEVPAGAIDAAKLTVCQRDATNGLYAQAAACFIRWLAPRLDDVREEFEKLRREARAAVTHAHARTSDIRAQLVAAYSIFVAFLADCGFESEASALPVRVGAALREAAEAQMGFETAIEPTSAFSQLLGSAIAAGAAHVADSGGYAPEGFESACGWRRSALGHDSWLPQGIRVGWLTPEGLYLDRNAAYRAAREMATDGTGVEVSCQTLGSRLKECGLLLTTDTKRETNSIRRKLDGAERAVWHVRPRLLGLTLADDPTNPTSRSQNVGFDVGSNVGKNGGLGETRQ